MADGRSMVGQPLSSVDTPAFVVQKKVVERNCGAMLETCRSLGVLLRAQTKTHKTLEGVLLQTGGSRRSLVCSTLEECEFFAAKDCEDILFGHPLTPHHMARVTRLTGACSCRCGRLHHVIWLRSSGIPLSQLEQDGHGISALREFHVMVDSAQVVQVLLDTAPPPGKRWSVFLKVDCGKGRAGVWHEDVAEGVGLVRRLLAGPHTTFMGVYVHCGDTYAATSQQELNSIRDNNITRILKFVEQLESITGTKCPSVGVGSTPSCRQPSPDMRRLTELHPGNYVFLDVQQHLLGSCALEDIAVCVATRVVGHYPRRNQILVDCGFTALTKQGWGKMETGYGVIKDHPHLRLCAMDQEHGFIEPLSPSDKLDYSRHPVGSLLFILPYHSCATAAMHSVYLVVENETVVEEWRPTRGW